MVFPPPDPAAGNAVYRPSALSVAAVRMTDSSDGVVRTDGAQGPDFRPSIADRLHIYQSWVPHPGSSLFLRLGWEIATPSQLARSHGQSPSSGPRAGAAWAYRRNSMCRLLTCSRCSTRCLGRRSPCWPGAATASWYLSSRSGGACFQCAPASP